MDEQTIFATALQQPTPAEREAYLDKVCADNDALRRHVRALIAAHYRVSGLLEEPLLLGSQEIEDVQPGMQIGNYRLLEEIGAGGFGIVYLADQLHPIHRRVAVKIVKLGMDTRQVVQRFQAERQALALMEHPSIAKVYDAGATESGRPYFVMEYVPGIPITEFCNQQGLNVEQRLRLLATVCRAIHHAHQKAIIHRDIKPSNVLVMQEDGQAIVKIIDFGIAKALQTADDADVPSTREHQLLGTPAYMSPEQAAGQHDQIDTRSDVYSLGVVGYELLVGQPPFAAEARGAAEPLQHQEDHEPLAPSQKVQRLLRAGDWQIRGIDGKKLCLLLRGDLDAILLTALAHDRGHRYQSALSLANDIERYLRNDPIEARAPSKLYRAGKFLRRHRAALTIALAPIILIAALVTTHWATRQRFVREHNARVATNRQRIELALHEAYGWYDPLRRKGQRDSEDIRKSVEAARRAEALLDAAEADTILVSRVRGLLSRLEREQADVQFLEQMRDSRLDFPGASSESSDQGIEHFRRAFEALGIQPLAVDVDDAVSLLNDRPSEVRHMAVAALDLWAVSLGEAEPELREWLQATARRADPDPWRTRLRDAIAQRNVDGLAELARAADLDQQPPPALMLLATVLQQHRHPAAFLVLRRAADAHPDVFVFHAIVGNLYSRQGASLNADAIRRAIRHLSSALAVRPDDVRVLNSLATNLSRTGEHGDAVSLLTRAVELHPNHWQSWHNLSLALMRQADFDHALDTLQQSLLRMHHAGSQSNLRAYVRQTLERIELCVQVAQSIPIEPISDWRYMVNPPEEWRANVPGDAVWASGGGPYGSSLFPTRNAWHTERILLQVQLPPLGFDDAENGRRWAYFFVVVAVAEGEVFVNEQLAVRFIDSVGDPRGYVWDSALPGDVADVNEDSMFVSASRTKSESYLDVQPRRLDVLAARKQLESLLDRLGSQLAEAEAAETSDEFRVARTAVRDAFESEAWQLLTLGR